MPAPYHVRLAVSQYGDQFRAELFTEDLGDTEGDVLTELPPSLAEWVPYLAQGAELPPDAARQLGKDLFAALLGQPENAKKWADVLARAEQTDRPVRLLIDATTDSVRDLPYGLLCEPHDDWFLFRGGKKNPVRFVRILRRCSPRPLTLGDRPRVLVAAAEPVGGDVPAFDAAGRLKALCLALQASAEITLVGPDGVAALASLAAETTNFAPFTRTTRVGLKAALAGSHDVFHLLAHGHGAGVLLCAPDGAPAETTAGELAEWCGAGTARLAFLQVCKAGQTGGRGGFGGVAQQLLSPRGGNLAAVVASTFPLDAEHSTTAAAAFYRALAAGKSPEEALASDTAEADWTWAFLELWARPGALGGTKQRAAFQFVSPYRGLSSFTERDADLFFGRRAEVAELLGILRTEPAVGVVGDSGSGKTSLLQAGLVNAVRQGGLAGLDRWRIVSLRPGYRPSQALLAALKPGDQTPPTPAALAAALRADDRPLLVIFDQFEEAFTLARDPDDARNMTEALADLVAERPDRFRLVIGMRSEFLGQSAGLPGLSRLLRRPWVLRPPGTDNLRDIVAGPAEHCGYTFQGPLADGNPDHAAGLLDRILADPLLASGDGAVPSLPLLQFALERLWLKAVETASTEFPHAAYDALGTAIAQHAEATYQATPTATGLGAGARAVAEHVITALVSSRGTRQPRPRAALEAETGKPDAARAVIDHLVGERLLTVRSDPSDLSASLVDLSHEAVIRHWDRLRGWLAEDPQGRAMRDEFRTAVEKWEAGFAGVPAKSARGLPGADVCRNYLVWIDTHKPQLPPLAAEFVAAMRGYLKRQKRTRQVVTVLLGLLTATAAGLALVADSKATQATKSAEDAKASEKQAKQSADAAMASEKVAKASEAEARRSAREAKVREATLALDRGIQTSEAGRPRLGLLDMAYALKACPPGDSGADAAALRKVIRANLAGWSANMFRLDDVRTLKHPAVATDSGGTVVACRLPDARVQLYDVNTGAELGGPIPALPVLPTSDLATVPVWADVHHDGQTVLVSNGDGWARLWRAGAAGGDRGELPGEVRRRRGPQPEAGHAGPPRPEDGRGRRRRRQRPAVRRRHREGDRHAAVAPGEGVRAGVQPRRTATRDRVRPPPGRPGGEPRRLAPPRRRDRQAAAAPRPQRPGDVRRVRPEGRGGRRRRVRRDDVEDGRVGRRDHPQRPAQAGRPAAERGEHRPGGVRPARPEPPPPAQPVRRAGRHPPGRDRVRVRGAAVPAGVGGGGGVPPGRQGVHRQRRRDRPPVVADRAQDDGPRVQPAARRRWGGGQRGAERGRAPGREVGRGRHPRRVRLPVPLRPPEGADEVRLLHCPGRQPHAGGRGRVQRRRPAADRPGPVVPGVRVRRAAAGGGRAGRPAPGRHRRRADRLRGRLPRRAHRSARRAGARLVYPRRPEGARPAARHPGAGRDRPPGRGVRGRGVPPPGAGGGVQPGPEAGGGRRPERAGLRVRHRHRRQTGRADRAPDLPRVGGGVREVMFDSAGDRLLTRCPRARGLWQADTGRSIHFHVNRVGIQVARFSPKGRLVLGGTNFNAGEVWRGDGTAALEGLLTHAGEVWGIAADLAEERVVTASYDHTARVWDVATGKPVSPPYRHLRGVSDADFTPDGKWVLTGSLDGTVRRWPVPEPMHDDEPRITAWIEATTGLRVTAGGGGVLLTGDEWNDSRTRAR